MDLSLSYFQKKYSHPINKGLTLHTFNYVQRTLSFDFNVYLPSIKKNLQRGFVWTYQQKVAFIISILKESNINPLVVIQNDEEEGQGRIYEVIDGKQRLSTMFAFFKGDFPIKIEGQDYFFSDLPRDCQRQLENFNFKWNIHYSDDYLKISDQTKIEIFEEANFLGHPQDIEHLNSLKNPS